MEEGEFTPMGVRRIKLSVLKNFQALCKREADGDYGKGIELLMEFYDRGILNIIQNHEERLVQLEQPEEEKPQKVKGFGG